MRDPCRICAVRVVGDQCRWIFSPAAKGKLQIILSHVLGWEVTRDGRGEFLCGKCVFQLEKVVECDVNISQLQEEHNSEIQKLQAEKDHLIQCIVHIYNKNNPRLDKSDSDSTSSKTPLGSSGLRSPDDEATSQPASEGQQLRESGQVENRMKRCVSLDQIVSKEASSWRLGLRSSRLGSAMGLDGSMKSFGLRGSRHLAQNVYFDLVQRKGMLPRPGFKDRSRSLQSLNRESSSDTHPEPPPKCKLREPKVFVTRHDAADEPGGEVQARALFHTSSDQPSVICDLIQLLRCISKQQVSAPAGSHIPVLKRLNTSSHNDRAKSRHRLEKSLHDLAEEFDDEYTPVRVKVVFFSVMPAGQNAELPGYELCCSSLLVLIYFFPSLFVCCPGFALKQSEVSRLESYNKLLTEELTQAKSTSESLTRTLEDSQSQNKVHRDDILLH